MMFRIFLAIIFICYFEQLSLAASPQTLEEINADLKAKKAELEPFDKSKVKIDLESLGLDDVDKKNTKELTETDLPELEQKPTTISSPQPKKDEPINKISETQNHKPEEKKEVKEVVNEERKKVDQTKAPKLEVKKSNDQAINFQKKNNLKKHLEIKRKRKENAQKQEEKLKKFYELRKIYLAGASLDNEASTTSEEKILPRKKDLNPFTSEELPALPILNRYRTSENLHIPIILTIKERIDLLFGAVSVGNVLSFNEAYKNIENPNIKNALGDTILTYSLLLHRYPIVASIIAKGADVNMPNKLGFTPMNIAIELGDFKEIEMLAENKADLNYVDAFGRSYLMQAARLGFLPAVDLLVKRGVDIDLMDKDGFTALAIAYRHKKEVIVQYLLKQGARTMVEKPYDPKTQTLIQELENRWK
ncbi:MAG: ankyrin repeat domain-containing protein [Proteobacteria bacterium]|nr:ankyrin repeat domain-containing protein [Pseudomonadota bacterium]